MYFSSKSLAGSGNKELFQGIEHYASMPFNKIFHNGWYDTVTDSDIKQYRMAEIVVKGGLPIENYLKRIICRTIAEKNTLLFLISKENPKLLNKYKNIIRYNPELDLFYNNGIFVKEIVASSNEMRIILNPPELRINRSQSTNVIIDTKIIIRWLDKRRKLVNIDELYAQIKYNKTATISINLKKMFSKYIELEIIFDNNQMFIGDISFENEEVFE